MKRMNVTNVHDFSKTFGISFFFLQDFSRTGNNHFTNSMTLPGFPWPYEPCVLPPVWWCLQEVEYKLTCGVHLLSAELIKGQLLTPVGHGQNVIVLVPVKIQQQQQQQKTLGRSTPVNTLHDRGVACLADDDGVWIEAALSPDNWRTSALTMFVFLHPSLSLLFTVILPVEASMSNALNP